MLKDMQALIQRNVLLNSEMKSKS